MPIEPISQRRGDITVRGTVIRGHLRLLAPHEAHATVFESLDVDAGRRAGNPTVAATSLAPRQLRRAGTRSADRPGVTAGLDATCRTAHRRSSRTRRVAMLDVHRASPHPGHLPRPCRPPAAGPGRVARGPYSATPAGSTGRARATRSRCDRASDLRPHGRGHLAPSSERIGVRLLRVLIAGNQETRSGPHGARSPNADAVRTREIAVSAIAAGVPGSINDPSVASPGWSSGSESDGAAATRIEAASSVRLREIAPTDPSPGGAAADPIAGPGPAAEDRGSPSSPGSVHRLLRLAPLPCEMPGPSVGRVGPAPPEANDLADRAGEAGSDGGAATLPSSDGSSLS